MFRHIREIVQFNNKSITVPDVGNSQLLFQFHPQYVRLEETLPYGMVRLKYLQTFIVLRLTATRALYTEQRAQQFSVFTCLLTSAICISPPQFFL